MKYFQINSSGGKILSIEYMRGIASLLVLLHHISLGMGSSGIVERLFFEARLGVQIFFFISGFIIPYSLVKSNYQTGDFLRFIFKRSIRIDPPIWVVIFLIFLVGTSFNFCGNLKLQTINDFKILLLNLFYLVPFIGNTCWYDGPFWTLGIEFQFYLIIGLTIPLLVKSRLSSIVYLLSTLAIWFINHTILKVDNVMLIPENLIFFTIGMTAFVWYLNKIKFTDFVILNLIYLIALYHGYGPVFVIVLFMSLLALFLIEIKIPVLSFLGTISYSLYLTHSPILHLSRNLIQIPSYRLLLQVFLSIGFATLFYYAIERNFYKLSKKIKVRS